MFLEVFVLATSLVLGFFLLVLTTVTQLQTYAASRDGRPTLTALLVSGFRKNRRNRPSRAVHTTGDPSTTGDGRFPGKKARRTERRRQKHALGTRSCRLQDELERRRQQVTEERLFSAKFSSTVANPICSGCRIVYAKKNCSYNCCARCCRTQTRSVCRAHGTGYMAAVESVEGAVQYKYTEFDLSYGHLKDCPPRVTSIGKQLVSLNLSNNRLSRVPEDLGTLSSLRELFLQYNNLTCLPESVGDLHHLVELDVKNNQLTELPASIGRLRRLVILNVTNNTLPNLPASLGRLTRLEELGLHSNQLTKLPEEICNLTSLKVMYSGENRLKGLPARFGRLTQLQELDVSGCELESLPQSLSLCVSLIRLWLSNNRLQTLPVHIGNLQQLKELHVRHNRLRYLPASMDLLHLYTFTAQNNKFVDEHTASEMCQTPTDAVPPLLEVAARAVLDHDLHWDSPSLPTSLREMLGSPGRCSACEGPFFNYYWSEVTFKTVGVFYRLPLCLSLCTPHLEHPGHP